MAEPRLLFKYFSLEGTSRQHSARAITDRELFFQNPARFNDPFDCAPALDLQGMTEAKAIAALYFGYARQGMLHEAALARAVQERAIALRRMDQAITSGLAMEDFHKHLERVGLLCMSVKSKNTLMWAHYADKHRGICLGFDALDPFFAAARQVFYSDQRPIVRRFRDHPVVQLVNALGIKDKVWQYEREWRVIKVPPEITDAASRVQTYPPEALRVVLLGARISSDDRQAVAGWLDGRAGVKVYGLKLDATTFRLRTVPMKFVSRFGWNLEPA